MKKTLNTLVAALVLCGTTQLAQAEEKRWEDICRSPITISDVNGKLTLLGNLGGGVTVDVVDIDLPAKAYLLRGSGGTEDTYKCMYEDGGSPVSIHTYAQLKGFDNCRLEGATVVDHGHMQTCEHAHECHLVCETEE